MSEIPPPEPTPGIENYTREEMVLWVEARRDMVHADIRKMNAELLEECKRRCPWQSVRCDHCIQGESVVSVKVVNDGSRCKVVMKMLDGREESREWEVPRA